MSRLDKQNRVEHMGDLDLSLSARLPGWQLMLLSNRLLMSLSTARGRREEPIAAAGGAAASAQKSALVGFLEESGGLKYSALDKDSLKSLCLGLDLRGDGDKKTLAARLAAAKEGGAPVSGVGGKRPREETDPTVVKPVPIPHVVKPAAPAEPKPLKVKPESEPKPPKVKPVAEPKPPQVKPVAEPKRSKVEPGADPKRPSVMPPASIDDAAIGGAGAAPVPARAYTEAAVLAAIDARRAAKPPKLTNVCAIGQQLQGRSGWPDKATRHSIKSVCEALLAAGTLVRFERPGGKHAEYRRPGDTADAGTALPAAGDDTAEYESSSDDDDEDSGVAIPAAKKEELDKALTWAEKQDSDAVLGGIVTKLGIKKAVLASEKACIELGIIYLGDVYHTSRTVSSAKMRDFIKRDALTWTPAQFAKHKLRAFFELYELGGYEVKRGHEFDVDHIIPKACGGIDHPRNYAIMARRLNSRFQEKMDEKLAIIKAPVRRQVLDFAQNAQKAAGAAVNAWIGKLPPLAGAERVYVE